MIGLRPSVTPGTEPPQELTDAPADRPASTDPRVDLPALTRTGPGCGATLWAASKTRRTVTTLDGLIRLGLQVRRRRDRDGRRFGVPLRPEPEGRLVLPQHEFGLDVIATVGILRHAERRGLPESHAELLRRGVPTRLRSVGDLLDRYGELLASSCADAARLGRITEEAGEVLLAIDGLQPDVGHESLWALRAASSGEVLLARSPLSSRQDDLARLIEEVKAALPVPIIGVASDGQTSTRNAVQKALGGGPHQLCPSHSLREAATPVSEADRHAKVRLKKQVRGIRPIERTVEGRADAEAEPIRGDCAAARWSSTDGGRPPRDACGLKRQGRLAAVAASPDRVGAQRGSRGS